MAKANLNRYRTFKTPEGKQISIFTPTNGQPQFHSLDGPAIKYPRSIKKPDEYFIYGIRYTKEKWLELKNDVKVTTNPFPTDNV
jgi:hypothetical protein